MKTLRSFVQTITAYGASIERTDAGNYYLVDQDGSVIESFCTIPSSSGDVLDCRLLECQVRSLLYQLKIYRLTQSIAEQMELDPSYRSND